jgi:hypothetical protein
LLPLLKIMLKHLSYKLSLTMAEPIQLTIDDLLIIKESLQYSTYNVENSQSHDSYEQKRDKLNSIAAVRDKVSQLIKQGKK